MANKPQSSVLRLLRQADLWFIIGLFGTLMLLILPVPSLLLGCFGIGVVAGLFFVIPIGGGGWL